MTPERRAEFESMLDALIPGERVIEHADRYRFPSAPDDAIYADDFTVAHIQWHEDHPEWSASEAMFAIAAPAIVRELLEDNTLMDRVIAAVLHGQSEWCPACYVHIRKPGLGEHMSDCPLAEYLEKAQRPH